MFEGEAYPKMDISIRKPEIKVSNKLNKKGIKHISEIRNTTQKSCICVKPRRK